MQTRLEYKTHTIILSEYYSFTKLTVFVKETITHDWFDIIIDSQYASRYVEGERILIKNFLKSLITLPTINFNNDLASEFSFFEDEGRYYIYCVQNDLPFNEQEWFKTAFIRTNIYIATAIAINKSLQLIARLYPQDIKFPDNSIDRMFDYSDQKSVFKPNYYEIEKILRDNGIDRFYHSTNTSNLMSIKQQRALLSIKKLREKHISVDFASSEFSREADARKGVENFVHLSYEPDYPMMKKATNGGRLAEVTMFIVSPVVAILKDTLFTEKNLVTTSIMPSSDVEVLKRIPFLKFHNKNYWSLSEDLRKSYMAEILVKDEVPASSILNWETL